LINFRSATTRPLPFRDVLGAKDKRPQQHMTKNLQLNVPQEPAFQRHKNQIYSKPPKFTATSPTH